MSQSATKCHKVLSATKWSTKDTIIRITKDTIVMIEDEILYLVFVFFLLLYS